MMSFLRGAVIAVGSWRPTSGIPLLAHERVAFAFYMFIARNVCHHVQAQSL